MSDWTKIIGAWPGDETDEEVEEFLNPPDAHEGMMTRREVLEEIAEINRWKKPEGVYQRAWRNGQLITYALCLGIMGFMPEQMLNAAHELALLMNTERGASAVRRRWRRSE